MACVTRKSSPARRPPRRRIALVKLDFGAQVDILSQSELDDSLHRANEAQISAFARGIKYMRLPRLMGTADTTGALALGGEYAATERIGPRNGFAWSIRRLAVNGLSSSDQVNLYRNTTAGDAIWSFTGNTTGFYQKFGRLELTLLGGETLALANSGSVASTSVITLSGELVEVPQEMLAKLA